ncbi:MAG: hypothetical protein U9N82_06625 [Thermodesulfobacteriota bacterium]|nr:hypothetical protein [Thermodesulfobacteriota bacterium]
MKKPIRKTCFIEACNALVELAAKPKSKVLHHIIHKVRDINMTNRGQYPACGYSKDTFRGFSADLFVFHITKERGRNNFHNYASRLQGIFVRSSISKSSK